MKKDNLYHAISVEEEYYDQDKTLVVLEHILKDQHLLSRRLQKDLDPEKGGFSGFDYISLYDNSLRGAKPYANNKFYEGYDSYHCYIANSLSLGFKRNNIAIIKPTLIRPVIFDWGSLEEMRYLGRYAEERYTDMPDEVQVKDKISLKNLTCLTLPVHLMVRGENGTIFDENGISDCLNKTKKLLEKYGYSIPIYDLYSRTKLDSEEKITKVYQKYSQNIQKNNQ